MKQIIRHTLALLLAVVITWSLCGINVVRLSCGLCHQSYVLLELVPTEKSCPCEGGCCECGHTHEHEDHIEHAFFQIDQSSQIEKYHVASQEIPFLVVFSLFAPKELTGELVLAQFESFSFIPPPPDRDVLCVYRC